MLETVLEVATKARDLTLIIAATAGVGMGAWRLWLADRKESREHEIHTKEMAEWRNAEQRRLFSEFNLAVSRALNAEDGGRADNLERSYAMLNITWMAMTAHEGCQARLLGHAMSAMEVIQGRESNAPVRCGTEEDLKVIAGKHFTLMKSVYEEKWGKWGE